MQACSVDRSEEGVEVDEEKPKLGEILGVFEHFDPFFGARFRPDSGDANGPFFAMTARAHVEGVGNRGGHAKGGR